MSEECGVVNVAQVVMERLRSRRALSREMRTKLRKSLQVLSLKAAPRRLELRADADGGDMVFLKGSSFSSLGPTPTCHVCTSHIMPVPLNGVSEDQR